MRSAANTEVLDAQFVARQRSLLAREREVRVLLVKALASEVNGLRRRRESGGAAEEGFGRGETASVDLERARAQYAQALDRLAEVDAAFARLDAGTYERCQVCGLPIGEGRLEAVPTATRCIRCEERRTRRRRR